MNPPKSSSPSTANPPRATKTIAYLRVSTTEQDLQKNKADILNLANDKDLGKVHWVEETVSGTVPWRKRAVGQIFEEVQSGDNLIVSELSRLGRSMLECMEMLSIAVNRGINIYAVKGAWRLDNTIQSKIVAMAFSMASEIERDLISQRTKEALAALKKKGVRLGRPKGLGRSKLDQHREDIESRLVRGATQAFLAKWYGTTEANLSRWIKTHKIRENVRKQQAELAEQRASTGFDSADR